MEDICIITRRLLAWISGVGSVPIKFAQDDTGPYLVTHPDSLIELYMVTEGSFDLSVGRRRAGLDIGKVAIANAHFGNEGRTSGGLNHYACISFDIAKCPELADLGHAPLLEVGRISDFEMLHQAYRRVKKAYHAPAEYFRDYRVKAETMLFLSLFAEEVQLSEGNPQRPGHDPVSQAVDCIQERQADAHLTLALIAASSHASPSHLCRLFKKRLGISPMQYLEHLRIIRATGLLERTDQDIKAVSATVGYSNQLYFSRVFRKIKGVSPSEYRMQLSKFNPQ